jgi:membrane-associated phospholipid phosphatase
MVSTDICKILAGRLRPDFIARCLPDIAGNCTNPNLKDVRDARASFPSGHSSLSFCAMVYLSLYLCGKFRIFWTNSGQLWKVVIVLSPLIGSTFIAISRTKDYHHNFDDVIAGSMLGACLAFVGYFIHYPSLLNANCDIPKNRFYVPFDWESMRTGAHVQEENV